MKKVFVLIILLTLLIFSGCGKDTTISDVIGNTNKTNISINTNSTINTNQNTQSGTTDDLTKANIDLTSNSVKTIKIASWNIQNFGEAKVTDGRIDDIVDVLDDFDIIAIQELSNLYEMVDDDCSRNINAISNSNYMMLTNAFKTYLNDSKWGIKISPYIVDERYGFIYDKSKVTLGNCYVVEDTNSGQLCEKSSTGLMVREPYVCEFIIKGNDVLLMTAHTSPSINFRELLALNIFYDAEKEKDDIILLGDLNKDCDYMTQGDPFTGYNTITYDDTTVSDNICDYDVFIYDTTQLKFNGNKGVIKVDKILSDHYLIWSEWNIVG